MNFSFVFVFKELIEREHVSKKEREVSKWINRMTACEGKERGNNSWLCQFPKMPMNFSKTKFLGPP